MRPQDQDSENSRMYNHLQQCDLRESITPHQLCHLSHDRLGYSDTARQPSPLRGSVSQNPKVRLSNSLTRGHRHNLSSLPLPCVLALSLLERVFMSIIPMDYRISVTEGGIGGSPYDVFCAP